MKLTILDRVLITQILPQKSNLAEQMACQELRKKLANIDEELKCKVDYKITDEQTGNFTWDINKDIHPVEFEFSELEKYLLKKGVDILDEAEEITPQILDICKRIKEI